MEYLVFILIGMYYYLIMDIVCITLMFHDVEQYKGLYFYNVFYNH